VELLDVENLDGKYVVVNGLNVRYIVRGGGLTSLILYQFKGGLACRIR